MPVWLSIHVGKNGAGEAIRTPDPNLGKSRSDVIIFIYNSLYLFFKSEHDPKMVGFQMKIP